MVNNVYRRTFSYTMHMIRNACNLRYKDAYISYYICHAQCKKCTKESYTYATKELPHTNSRNQINTKLPPQTSESCLNVEGPYNKDSTVKTSGWRGVYGKFHAHF
jgi:hypothetical protein